MSTQFLQLISASAGCLHQQDYAQNMIGDRGKQPDDTADQSRLGAIHFPLGHGQNDADDSKDLPHQRDKNDELLPIAN